MVSARSSSRGRGQVCGQQASAATGGVEDRVSVWDSSGSHLEQRRESLTNGCLLFVEICI